MMRGRKTDINSNSGYPPTVWATIKALYECGSFPNKIELHKHCKTLFTKCPSLSAIEKTAQREEWDKHRFDEEIEKKQRQNYIDIFAELGVDERETALLIKEGMYAGRMAFDEVKKALTKQTEDLESELKGELISESLDTALKAYFQNLNVSHRYIDLKLKLTGEYQPIKVKENQTVEKNVNVEHKLTTMTDDEIQNELSRVRNVINNVISKEVSDHV